MNKYEYWMNYIRQAEKLRPDDEWDDAENWLNVTSTSKMSNKGYPFVNGFRLHYDGLKSYLDQREARFKITPTRPFTNDVTSNKQAECDFSYLTYLWRENKLQVVESKKLDSAIIRNLGVTCVAFDKKKWMPTLKYIPAKNFLLDPHCEGDWDRADWMGYKETIPLEELLSIHDLDEEDIQVVKGQSGSALEDDQYDEYLEEDEEQLQENIVVTVYHIYARNSAAVKDPDSEDDDVDEDLEATTPKKYLKFVKGLTRPLVEDDEWVYDLDDNEFPLTPLRFNTPTESSFGYTDYAQMKKVDTAFNGVMHDINESAEREGNKKYTGPKTSKVSESEVNSFLKNQSRQYIPGLVDSKGNLLIQEIGTGAFNNNLAKAAEFLQSQRQAASALGELLSEEVREYKDVTALAAKLHDANIHQKVNRRLNGPEGYEQSINEDAIKLLEIAHQYVPRYSLIEVEVPRTYVNEDGELEEGETYTDLINLPWSQAQRALATGGKLIKLGVDAIVGQELAQYWRTSEETPQLAFKLSTNVRVVPGSTRNTTQEERAAVLKQYFLEVYMPLYQSMGRIDYAIKFANHIGKKLGLDDSEDLLPDEEEIQQIQQQMQQQQGDGEQELTQAELAAKKQKMQAEQAKTQLDLQGKRQQQQIDAMKAGADISKEKQAQAIRATEAAAKLNQQLNQGAKE